MDSKVDSTNLLMAQLVAEHMDELDARRQKRFELDKVLNGLQEVQDALEGLASRETDETERISWEEDLENVKQAIYFLRQLNDRWGGNFVFHRADKTI